MQPIGLSRKYDAGTQAYYWALVRRLWCDEDPLTLEEMAKIAPRRTLEDFDDNPYRDFEQGIEEGDKCPLRITDMKSTVREGLFGTRNSFIKKKKQD